MSAVVPVALITGAARRLGARLARRLAAEGWAVVINYRSSSQEAQALVTELQEAGGRARCHQADISDAAQVESMFDSVTAQEGRLDLLINNVGNYAPGPLRELTPADWDSCIGSNLSGAYYCSHHALPLLEEAGGQIINIGYAGVDALVANADAMAYQVSKTGLWSLTKALAAGLGPDVRVNMVSPGQLQNSIDLPADPASVIPMGRAGTLDEVADTVLYLLGADYVTGVNIDVAGGYRL